MKKDLAFNLDEFKRVWSKIQKENNFKNASSTELKKWFDLSGLLLEVSGEAVFAEELEKIVFSGIGKTIEENKKIVAPKCLGNRKNLKSCLSTILIIIKSNV